MSRSLFVALAAGAALAVAALASGGASAKPMGIILPPKPGPIGIIKPPIGVKPPMPGPVMGVIIHPKPGPVTGVIIPPKPFPGIVIHPPHHDDDDDHPHMGWWWWHHHHHFPWVVGESAPVMVTGPTATVTGPAPVNGPCTCLTKTYLGDGSVKFTDVCTKETAIATPDELRAQR